MNFSIIISGNDVLPWETQNRKNFADDVYAFLAYVISFFILERRYIVLTSLGFIFLCGLLLGSLFKKLQLPSLVGMLITGIVLGPYVLNVLDNKILLIGSDLRELALIIILTRAGLSLDFKDLKTIGRPGILMSFLPACFEMAATILFAPMILGISYLEAALLAAVVASASPAVIVPRMLKLMDEKYGVDKNIPQMILAGDSIDDVFNIVVFTALLTVHIGGNVEIGAFLNIPSSIILGILLGLGIGLMLSWFFNKCKIAGTYQIIIILSIGFLAVGLEHILEGIIAISGLLAVMVSGLVIYKKSPHTATTASKNLSYLWMGAEILLFVLLGSTVDITLATGYLWQTVLLLSIILTIRGVGILVCLIGTKLTWKERFFCTLTGIPKATVQAAIGGIPLAMGIPSGELILSVAVITILITAPLGAFLIDRTYQKLLQPSL